MDKETLAWMETQVSSGRGLLIVRDVIAEISNRLTPEELAPLGDLTEAVESQVNKPETNVKAFIEFIVTTAKAGVISKSGG